MVRLRYPRVVWHFQTPICFPAMKEGLILEYKLNTALIWWSSIQESHWWDLFHNESRVETLQLGLEFGNFKPWFRNGISNCIFRLNSSLFGGFAEEGVNTYLMTTMLTLHSPTSFCLHICSLRVWPTWKIPQCFWENIIEPGQKTSPTNATIFETIMHL
jgi:hypothetical protein